MLNLKKVSGLGDSTINSASKHSNITYFNDLTRNETVIYRSLFKLIHSEKEKDRLLITLSNRFSMMCSRVLGEASHHNADKLNKVDASDVFDSHYKHLCRKWDETFQGMLNNLWCRISITKKISQNFR